MYRWPRDYRVLCWRRYVFRWSRDSRVSRWPLALDVAEAIRRARKNYPDLKIEAEADTVAQAQAAAEAGADIILLDNMSCDELRQAVGLIEGRAKTEASGGVTLETVREIAETGVDYISVGALTHSAPSVDIALDFDQLS